MYFPAEPLQQVPEQSLHHTYRADIKAPCKEVCGNQDLGLASPELVNNVVPVPLLHVACDVGDLVPLASELQAVQ